MQILSIEHKVKEVKRRSRPTPYQCLGVDIAHCRLRVTSEASFSSQQRRRYWSIFLLSLLVLNQNYYFCGITTGE